MSSRLPRPVVIGTAAGAFSGLFGVGGGTIIVPLLVLWLDYEQREATASRSRRSFVIGVLAAVAQAAYRNVDFSKGCSSCPSPPPSSSFAWQLAKKAALR